jgi:hypothetical protein
MATTVSPDAPSTLRELINNNHLLGNFNKRLENEDGGLAADFHRYTTSLILASAFLLHLI